MGAPSLGLVLGGGEHIWREILDLELMLGHPWDGVIAVVNDVGVHWPRPFDHWCTLHPQKMGKWKDLRASYGHPGDYKTWCRYPNMCDAYIRPHVQVWKDGSSSLFAVQVLRVECEVDRIVLCGVPMTKSPHFKESYEIHRTDGQGNWNHSNLHWPHWERMFASGELSSAWLRSMSGRTRDLLGAPTVDWLTGRE